jgi:hypothetical protein
MMILTGRYSAESSYSVFMVPSSPLVIDLDEPLFGCKKVEFTGHVLDRMEQRGITQKQVLDALREPDVRPQHKNPSREQFRTFVSKTRSLDVVMEMIEGEEAGKEERPVIITAMWRTLKPNERPK